MDWRSLGDSNPCLRRERAVSWAARRRERLAGGVASRSTAARVILSRLEVVLNRHDIFLRPPRASGPSRTLPGDRPALRIGASKRPSPGDHCSSSPLTLRPPTWWPAPEHGIPPERIHRSVRQVLGRLVEGGFEAYLVGGCVRDLLLGRVPKDFDVATSARPEEVRALFPRSRLIGRRFRLAHVRAGRDVYEVATFRASHDAAAAGPDGMLLHDNVYGTRGEDALRRDFTVNALYYDDRDGSILDFTGGFSDLDAGVIRSIGDPGVRYREDPVRILRAVRFAAKLGFRIEPSSAAPILELAPLLEGVPPRATLRGDSEAVHKADMPWSRCVGSTATTCCRFCVPRPRHPRTVTRGSGRSSRGRSRIPTGGLPAIGR